jgi:membrane fusion protein (multidrug efflux system)
VRSKYQGVQAQVDQAKLNLENTKIRAPVDGAIAKKSLELGQLAAPGVPLIGFVGDSERWVIANFKETEIEGVKAGSPVSVDVDAIGGKTYKGTVTSLSAATGATFTLLPPDNATGNFTKVVQRVPVKIKLENLTADDLELLRAGLSAYVKVRKN